VLKKLDQAGVGRGALVRGFDCGEIQRDVVEDWIAKQGRTDAEQQKDTLFWARFAGIGTAFGVVIAGIGLLVAAISLWLQLQPPHH
jgi:hypothetical protein